MKSASERSRTRKLATTAIAEAVNLARPNYDGAPSDGSAWLEDETATQDEVARRALRGGGLRSTDRRCRVASRYSYPQAASSYYVGFRACITRKPNSNERMGCRPML